MGNHNLTTARKQFLHTVFVTAIEGGVSYWASVPDYHWSDGNGKDDIDGFSATLLDSEDGGKRLRVDIDTIARGVDLFTRYCHGEIDHRGKEVAPSQRSGLRPDHYWNQFLEAEASNGEDGDYDSDVADHVLQFGLFGEVVYG